MKVIKIINEMCVEIDYTEWLEKELNMEKLPVGILVRCERCLEIKSKSKTIPVLLFVDGYSNEPEKRYEKDAFKTYRRDRMRFGFYCGDCHKLPGIKGDGYI